MMVYGIETEVSLHKDGGQQLEPPSGYESEISAFLAWVQLERGLSRHTVESYETDLIQCACFFGQMAHPIGRVSRLNKYLPGFLH